MTAAFHRSFRALLPVLALVAAALPLPHPAPPTHELSFRDALTVERLQGADRYATAANVSAQYGSGVPTVYVATGRTFPDALAAGPAAGSSSPVLIVDGGRIPAGVTAEVTRLHPGRVVLVGGPSAVPDSVGVTLGALAADGWTRLSGPTRYDTAVAVSAKAFAPGVPVAFVATGRDFPDALTGAALGARLGGPVLLTDPRALPDSVAQELVRLRPAKIVILGGTGAVSASVGRALGALSGTVLRYQGPNRYATNAAALAELSSAATLVVATGANFPDALTGSALVGLRSGALLLTGPAGPTSAGLQQVGQLKPATLLAVGGPLALPEGALLPIRGALGDLPQGDLSAYTVNKSPNGQVLRWNPCRTIHYRVNPGGLGGGVVTDVQAALGRIAAASGLSFAYDGNTSFVPTSSNRASQPAALVVAVAAKAHTDLYDGAAIGEGGWAAQGTGQPGGGMVWQITSGFVVLDPSAAATKTGGFGQGDDRGPLLLHELGHAVGLGHVTDQLEIMYPTLRQGGPRAYGAGDLAGLAAVGSGGGCIS